LKKEERDNDKLASDRTKKWRLDLWETRRMRMDNNELDDDEDWNVQYAFFFFFIMGI